jgi:glycosyltransferase involved in cell wall biosynthesis
MGDRQALVSMVVPCYNKAPYIVDMLQSVYDQKWDGIELILVNDGSTDGTREIIAEWEPRLVARGYKVVIVDQENQGLAATVRNGMRKMSGKYFCTPDCDDELDPEYVSAMAGWLEEHGEYDWCGCDFAIVRGDKTVPRITPESLYEKNPVEKFLFFRIEVSVCKYMVRTDYLAACGIPERFETAQRVSREPQLAIPLMLGGGRLKHIDRALYQRKILPGSMSASVDGFEKCMSFWNNFFDLIIRTLENRDTDTAEKKCLVALAKIARLRMLFSVTGNYEKEFNKSKHGWAEETAALIKENFCAGFDIAAGDIAANPQPFFSAFVGWVLGEFHKPAVNPRAGGRVIACGALGKQAGKLLPLLSKTELAPTDLWDVSAQKETRIKDIAVSKPDYESLSKIDTALVFPADPSAAQEILDCLAGSSVGRCLYVNDIEAYLADFYFPQFKKQSVFAG